MYHNFFLRPCVPQQPEYHLFKSKHFYHRLFRIFPKNLRPFGLPQALSSPNFRTNWSLTVSKETKPCVFLCFDYSQKWFGRWGQKFKNMLTACVQYAQKNNASLVGYKISCFFIQMMRSNENVTSACQRTMARWAVGPAQASAQLWTLGALRLHLSATVTHTQSQRYCSLAPRARLRAEKRGGRRWRRRATTRVYSCFYSWHATAPQHPTSSKTSTHAQFQRYCARGSRARLGAALGGLPTKTYPLQCPRGHDGEGGAKSCASTAASTAGMRCVQPLVGTWS